MRVAIVACFPLTASLLIAAEPAPAPMPPEKAALAMKLPEQGRCKSFVILLTGILRRYLERRYDLPARRQTTAELLQAIQARADVGDNEKRWLRGFLDQAEVVKFSAGEPNPACCSEMADEVRQFFAASSTMV